MHKENKLATAKRFVQRHKVGIAVSATFVGMSYLQYRTAQHWNNFLKEEGLYDKYYNPEEEI